MCACVRVCVSLSGCVPCPTRVLKWRKFQIERKMAASSVAHSRFLLPSLSLTLSLHLASVRSGNELTLRPLPPCLPSFLALWANCRKILANRKRNKMQIYFSSSPFELLRKYNKQLFPLLFVFVERFKLSPDCALRSLCNQYKTRVHLGALRWPRRGVLCR